MGKVVETVSTINSFLRTMIVIILLGAFGTAAYLGYEKWLKPELLNGEELEKTKGELLESKRQQALLARQIAEKQREIEILTVENERLETAKRLLKVDHRLARVQVKSVGVDPATGKGFSVVEFREIGDDGKVIGEPKEYRLAGDEIRVDCWIVSFDDKYVEEADLLRGTSLCVFKKIYGNGDGPDGGHVLEGSNSRPLRYAGKSPKESDFEKKIWSDFWEISTNPEKAQEMGIRANHGQVNYVKAKEGVTYLVELRASGGSSIRALDEEEKNAETPAG